VGGDKGYKPASNQPTKDKGLYGDKNRLKASRKYAKQSENYGKNIFFENEGKGYTAKNTTLPSSMLLLRKISKKEMNSSDFLPSDVAIRIGKTAYAKTNLRTAYNTGKKNSSKPAPKKPASSRRGMK
jgi:hypothetical protein